MSLQNLPSIPVLEPPLCSSFGSWLSVLVPCRTREPDQQFGAPSLETSKKKTRESLVGEEDARTTPGLQVLASVITQ